MRKLQQILNEGVRQKAWAAAALGLLKPGQPAGIALAGKHTYDSSRLLRETDLFDLASLTKVIVTTTLTAQLINTGKLRLDDKVSKFLPEFLAGESAPDAAWRRQVSLQHLLAHCSGLPPGRPFHQLPRSKNRDFRKMLCETRLLEQPGTQEIYSDLGILLLGEIIQSSCRDTLDNLARQRIFTPCGMSRACYNPPPRLRSSCVPTELRTDIGIPWQGVVHDETARWLGGVAAHAGVFASILDLCRFAECLLAGKGVFGSPVFEEFVRPANLVSGSSRCLGWDCRLSTGYFGHTGFTGTSLWFDAKNHRAIILLSNAVYPHRKCKENTFPEFRRELTSTLF